MTEQLLVAEQLWVAEQSLVAEHPVQDLLPGLLPLIRLSLGPSSSSSAPSTPTNHPGSPNHPSSTTTTTYLPAPQIFANPICSSQQIQGVSEFGFFSSVCAKP